LLRLRLTPSRPWTGSPGDKTSAIAAASNM
jgi:hypothetical protein